MTRYGTIMLRSAAPLAVLAAAGLALAGCASSAATRASAPAGSRAAASSSPAAGSGVTATSASFPIAVGDTWVYDTKLGTGAVGRATNKILAVTPTAGGQQVTMSVDTGIAKAVTVTYVFHPDGSISVPVTQLGGTVTLTSGSVVWPSKAQLASGQSRTSTLLFSIKAAGATTHATAKVTVSGKGIHTVTVPAGTYQAQVVSERFSEELNGVNISFTLDTWLAPGTGPVESQLLPASGSSIPSTVQVLKSFTKG